MQGKMDKEKNKNISSDETVEKVVKVKKKKKIKKILILA